MKYNNAIEQGLRKNCSHVEIARKVYLCYPTDVFVDNEEIAFEILDKISSHFQVPLTNIQVVGSSKIGFSYHQSKDFVPGESDLDIAVIDTSLFIKYTRVSLKVTKGYKDLTRFKTTEQYRNFASYLLKGMLRPDLMPRCQEKSEWFDFFNGLSSNYYQLFKNINGGIYADHFFFEEKQASIVNNYLNHKSRK